MIQSIFISFFFIAVCSANLAVEIAFVENGIVPDLISVPPKHFVTVEYSTGVSAYLGNEITPTQGHDKPKLSWQFESDALYTLIMADPDVPSRANPADGEFRHWLVVNIPQDNIAAGQTIVDYMALASGKDTGFHRYTFLVFKQNEPIEFNGAVTSSTDARGRFKTSVRDFVEQYQLGRPIAGNFFHAQYDDNVPKYIAGFTL